MSEIGKYSFIVLKSLKPSNRINIFPMLERERERETHWNERQYIGFYVFFVREYLIKIEIIKTDNPIAVCPFVASMKYWQVRICT